MFLWGSREEEGRLLKVYLESVLGAFLNNFILFNNFLLELKNNSAAYYFEVRGSLTFP